MIVNPIAGRRRHDLVSETLELLRAEGHGIELHETGAAGDARRLAAEARASGVERLVVAGGDGTINEAVSGLAASYEADPDGTPALSIIPLGTANVLAAEIGLAPTPAAIARTIAAGTVKTVPLGRVAMPRNGEPRYFVLMAGAGFDAHVVDRVDLGLKRWIGKGAYLWQCLKMLLAHDFPRYRVRLDGVEHEASSVIVTNAKHYAGRYTIAPQARLEEPLLYACLFEGSGALNTLRYALALGGNRLWRLSDVSVLPARAVRIEGPAGDPLQGDGDIIGRLPCEITLLPEALRLTVPPAGQWRPVEGGA